MNWQTVWDILDKAGAVIGLATFLFSILIWLIVKQQQRKIKKLMGELGPAKDYETLYTKYQQTASESPAALCISLLRGTDSIKKAVTGFLEQNNLKTNITEEIKMDGINTKDDIQVYIHELRKARRGPLAEATELRLFIAGPVQAGTIAGAVFDNWIPVLLYHKGSDGYEYWGPLLKN